MTDPENTPDEVPAEVYAERALLGAALLDQRAALTLLDVPLDDYLDQRHAVIAGAIRDVVGELDRPDPVLVLDRLHAGGHHEITLAELHRLFAVETPSITSAARYAAIIRRRARHRRTVHVAADLSAAALRGDDAEIRRLTAQLVELDDTEEPDQ